MPKAERTMKAALLIQRWYRRSLARMEMRRRYTWTIFTELEYASEQDQMKLHSFFNALLTHLPEAGRVEGGPGSSEAAAAGAGVPASPGQQPQPQPPPTTPGPADGDDDIPPVDASYRGAHLGSPLTRGDLDNLLDAFRRKKPLRLHPRYAAALLREAAAHLRTLPNLNEASSAHARHVTVCGDLHGHLDDLLVIFHKNGLPSAENPYVFNGDFVDRGRHGMEVFLLLLACLLALPGGVFLNRGNHEDLVMNARYGFIREVRTKYKRAAEPILRLLEEVYRWLPLGTLVDGRALAVHGGVSDHTDLAALRALPRHKYPSLLRPPGGSSAPPAEQLEWKQLFDLLWSDPQPAPGCTHNKLRGAGVCFGPDVSAAFLRRHGLSLLLRSHECKPAGFELARGHAGRVATVFSASDYYDAGSNTGAYVTLSGDLAPHPVQFQGGAARARGGLSIRQRLGLVEAAALRELRAQVAVRSGLLLAALRKRDPGDTGLVSVPEWCAAMEEVTRLRLPWRLLLERLIPADRLKASGRRPAAVRYADALRDLAEATKQQPQAPLSEALYRNKDSLQAIFRLLDRDHSGALTAEELEGACALLAERAGPGVEAGPGGGAEAAADLCRCLDINKDGSVDLNEFLEAFRLVQLAAEAEAPLSPDE